MSRYFIAPLATERLWLRRLQAGDEAALCAYRSLPEVARYQSWTTYTLEDAAKLVADYKDGEPGVPGTWFQLAMVEQGSHRLIGDCGLHCRGDDPRLMELGVTLSPEVQRKGYATEALTAVVDFIFATLGKHRISAVTDAENAAARALFLRLGFRQEALFVDHLWFKGAWDSECVFALLQREWAARQTQNESTK